MVKSCCAIGCAKRFTANNKVGFHRFPLSNANKLALWVAAIKRKNWIPNKYSYICGQHFQTGKPSPEPNHPDYVPNVFVFSKGRKRDANLVHQRAVRARTRDKNKVKKANVLQENYAYHKICEQQNFDGPIQVQEALDTEEQTPEVMPLEEQTPEFELQEEQTPKVELVLQEFRKVVKINDELKREITHVKNWNYELSNKVKELNILVDKLKLECTSLKQDADVLERKNIAFKTLLDDNASLTKTIRELSEKNNKLLNKEEVNMSKFVKILDVQEKCKFYTGLPDKSVFDIMLKHVLTRLDTPKKDVKKITNEHKFLIILMKIRLNLKNKMLADIFDVSEGFVSRLFLNWLPHVAPIFSYLIEWPTKESINNSKPKCFKGTPFENCTVIINCFEVRTQKPTNQDAQTLVFSAYKNHQTIKFLVAIAPNGTIIFISDAWGGHSSDKEITLQSGLLKLLKPYDVVLADKGFLVHDEFIKAKVKLVMPAFRAHDSQLTSAEVMHSQNVSNLRIHVERVIGQLRNFKILNDVISTRNFKCINYIVPICCGIVNLNPPIIN